MELNTVSYDNGRLIIIDTTKLPGELCHIELKTQKDCFDAIKELKVRGAPAIGVAAAYSLALVSDGFRGNSKD
jgi:methylthioribose-1-phosphate isomerase